MFIPYPLATHHLLGAAHYLSFYQSGCLQGIPVSSPSLTPVTRSPLKVRHEVDVERRLLDDSPQSRVSAGEQSNRAAWHQFPNRAPRAIVRTAHARLHSRCRCTDGHWMLRGTRREPAQSDARSPCTVCAHSCSETVR